jgi:hypothetical protein
MNDEQEFIHRSAFIIHHSSFPFCPAQGAPFYVTLLAEDKP